MPEGVPPFAIYDPGADSGSNNSRRIAVRAVTVHTTEGNDSRGLGKTRHHNSPGTFNFLVRDEGVYCYYPAHVRCSHAAGGNYAGPGIENEGFTGRPFSEAKLEHFGQLAHWLHDTYGVPFDYKPSDPRIYLDQSNYHGFIAHRAITYPPNTSFNHYDFITPDEFARAIGSTQGDDDLPDEATFKKWVADVMRWEVFADQEFKNAVAHEAQRGVALGLSDQKTDDLSTAFDEAVKKAITGK